MKLQTRLLIAIALLAGLSVFRAPGQSQTAMADTNGSASAKPAATADKAQPSSGVADILKMLDAGVSKEVVKVYIENSSPVQDLSSADLIALKERGVADDLTLVLLKRGSENKAQAASVVATAGVKAADPAAVQPVRVVNSGRLDPESYEYFQRYYLQSRALGYSQQLMGYQPGLYGYGFYPPLTYGYGPRFSGGYGYRPRF